MILDPKEIEIISKARQKNIRDHKRSKEHFDRIFHDFFRSVSFDNTISLDLGPGHYDFGEIVRTKGGRTEGIDNDPAVLELGKYKTFKVHDGNLKKIDSIGIKTIYNGLFCKLSINVFWKMDIIKVSEYTDCLFSLLDANAWVWIAPWNGLPKSEVLSHQNIEKIKDCQIESFKAYNCRAFELDESLCKYYGVHGVTVNSPLFVKGLNIPEKLLKCVEY